MSKPIQPELDLGHMLAIDPNQTEFSEEKVMKTSVDYIGEL